MRRGIVPYLPSISPFRFARVPGLGPTETVNALTDVVKTPQPQRTVTPARRRPLRLPLATSARPTMQHELPLARHGDSPSARKVAGEEPDPCRTPPSQRCGFCVQSSLPWAAGFWIQACTEGDSHRLLLEASKSAQSGIDRSRIGCRSRRCNTVSTATRQNEKQY